MRESTAAFDISPQRAVADIPLSVRLTGLQPGQPVTIRATIPNISATEIAWQSKAQFRAGDDGIVDLANQAPLSGSYASADPMGPVWSATLPDPAMAVPEPVDPLASFLIEFDALIGEEIVATASVERQIMGDGIRREVVRDDGLYGSLFLPEGPGPHPAVMIVSGSDGGLYEPYAALYASHGYASFALAYFNYEALPKALMNIPLEYFEKGIRYLQSRTDIDGARLAITGASRGGELSLLLGSQFPQFKAVVAVVPSGLVWGGFGGPPEDGLQPAWTRHGEAFPYMDGEIDPDDYAYVREYVERKEGIPTTPGFNAQIDKHPERVERATIPVEKTQGPILMISGEDDQMWPSTRMAEISMQRLRDRRFEYSHEHLSCAGAGHMIWAPYFPVTVIDSKHPVDGVLYALGGDAESNMKASVDAWARIFEFLSEHL